MVDKKNAILIILSFLAIAAWMMQMSIKYNEFIFSLFQTAASLVLTLLVIKTKLARVISVFLVFFLGWSVSFGVSFFLEWVVTERFLEVLYEQFSAQVLSSNFLAWFMISFFYMGSFQAVFFYLFIFPKERKG